MIIILLAIAFSTIFILMALNQILDALIETLKEFMRLRTSIRRFEGLTIQQNLPVHGGGYNGGGGGSQGGAGGSSGYVAPFGDVNIRKTSFRNYEFIVDERRGIITDPLGNKIEFNPGDEFSVDISKGIPTLKITKKERRTNGRLENTKISNRKKVYK